MMMNIRTAIIPSKMSFLKNDAIVRLLRIISSYVLLTRNSLMGYFIPFSCFKPRCTYGISFLFIAEKTASLNTMCPDCAIPSMRDVVFTASP